MKQFLAFTPNLYLIPGFALMLGICSPVSAQNLVPNPGFENYVQCPFSTDESGPMNCPPWYGNSTNYFNSCTVWPSGVPENFRGFQYAHGGEAYVGGYQMTSSGGVERVWATLLEPLIAGECYEVSYYFSRADMGCAIDHMGALLTDSVDWGTSPQIDWSGQFFGDSVGWMHIVGHFIATGEEDIIVLGNFYADPAFDPDCDLEFPWAYYYFDDVVVQLSFPGGPFTVDLGGPYDVCDSIVLTTGIPNAYYTWSDGSHGPALTVTESGTYSVTVSRQCVEAEGSTEVTVLGSPPVVLGNDLEMCPGETFTVTLDPLAGDYLWSDGSTSSEYTFSATGHYVVTLNDNGCDLTFDDIYITVTDPPPPVALGPDTTLCSGDSLVFDFDPALGLYEWLDGSDAPLYIIDAQGIYAVTIANACGTESDDIEVTFEEPPEFTLGPDSVYLCVGEVIEFSFDEDQGDFVWQDGSTGSSFQINGPGQYGLTVTNACGTFSDEISVTEIDFPDFELGGTVYFCPGGSVVLNGPDIYGDFTWQDGSSGHDYLVTAPGIYALTITNACGSYADFVVVEFMQGIELPDLGPDLSLCPGDEVVLYVNQSSGDILWSDFSTGSSLLVTMPGTYHVTVSTECGDFSDTIQVIPGNDSPDLNLSADVTLCAGQSTILDAGITNATFLWSDGSQLSQIEVSVPGTYIVTATNACGSAIDSVTVFDGGPPPVVVLGADTALCPGDTIVLAPFYADVNTWFWPDGSDSETYSVFSPQEIIVGVVNDCGMAQDTISISALPPAPELDLGSDTVLCPGESLSLEILIPDVVILWSDGTSDPDLTVSDSGAYSAVISNACGVSADTITISMLPDIPVPDLGPDQTICPGEMITIAPGIPDVTYLWHDGSTGTEFQTTQQGTVHVTVANACGSASDTLVITESMDGPQLDLGPDVQACAGESVSIPAGIYGVSYLWHDGSMGDVFTTFVSGTYFLTVQNLCGSDSDTINVTISGTPPVTDLGPDTMLCSGSVLTLSAELDSSVSRVWQDGSTGFTYDVIASGAYALSQSNQCGTTRDTIVVLIDGTAPAPDIGNDTTLCAGSVLSLISVADSGTVTSWQDGSSAPVLLVTESGMYILTQTNRCGQGTDSIAVAFLDPPPVFSLGMDTVLCPGESLPLSAPGGAEVFQWQDGSSNTMFLVDEPGVYALTVSNPCGSVQDEVLVTYDMKRIELQTGDEIKLCAGDEIVVDVTQGFAAAYAWNTGSAMSAITIESPGIYSVTITTDCEERTEDFIAAVDGTCIGAEFYLPNVFSPNGDHVNDLFTLLVNANIEILSVQGSIFDRWGDLVFSSSASPFAWDGRMHGVKAAPGVYVYVLSIHYKTGGQEKSERLFGDVTLVE